MSLAFQTAVAKPVPRWLKIRKAFIEAIRWQVGSFYRVHFYRHHMRLIHPRWHQWTRLHPFDGPRMDLCQWCGERRFYCETVKPTQILQRKDIP